MRIIERYAGDIAVLDCHGPLRVPDAPELLHTAIGRLVDAGRRTIVLNLEDVPSIDAGGLGALVNAHMLLRRHHGRVRLAQVTPHVRHLLVMSRLADVFEPEGRAYTRTWPSSSTITLSAIRSTSSRSCVT